MRDATFLLVHGAWHGAWTWDHLVPALEGTGHQVRTVELASHGAAAEGLGDLAADVAIVTEALDAIEGPVVLVAHSYGGIPITQAAAGRDDVSHLVYVCAFLLDVGDSLLSSLGGAAPDWIEPTADGSATRVTRPREVFYADVEEQVAAACEARLSLQSIPSFADTLTAAAWTEIPSTYVICEQDQAIPPPAQEAMSGRAGTVHRLSTSHSPFLSQPEELAAILTGVTAGTSEPSAG